MSAQIEQLNAAEKAIKNGWVAGLVSLGMTIIVMLIGMYSAGADLGPMMDGGLFLLGDVLLMAVLIFFMYRKSRVAVMLMFVYFLASKALQIILGDYRGLVVGALFLFFYGRAVWGTFIWHKIKDLENSLSVFSEPVKVVPQNGRLFN